MTREQAKTFLAEKLGITEPTDDQIGAFLNNLNGEIATVKNTNKDLADKASKYEDVLNQLEEMKKKEMTDIELANAEKDKALADMTALQARLDRMELENQLAKKGLVGDEVTKLLDSIGNSKLDVDALATLVSMRETDAINRKEQELLSNSSNPSGGNVSKPAENKTEGEKLAELIGKNKATSNATSKSVIDSYK